MDSSETGEEESGTFFSCVLEDHTSRPHHILFKTNSLVKSSRNFSLCPTFCPRSLDILNYPNPLSVGFIILFYKISLYNTLALWVREVFFLPPAD